MKNNSSISHKDTHDLFRSEIDCDNDLKIIKNNSFFVEPPSFIKSFQIQNRRFLGNKFKLLKFIRYIVDLKCKTFDSFCDIFAGTGVVGSAFNEKEISIISNDILMSNYVSIYAFLASQGIDIKSLKEKTEYLNKLDAKDDNYFSVNYGNTFFTLQNARKIGRIREEISSLAENAEEEHALLTSLLYACDKVANTVGHYDAFRKELDSTKGLQLKIPEINFENNCNNVVYNKNANELIREIQADVLYIDPPYNSRQYCDTYHLLENLITWNKPELQGKAKKMNRDHLKSRYCFKGAYRAMEDLIENATCEHILISYNNTGETKNSRSNARITDEQIISILEKKGNTEVFEYNYKLFTTGKSNSHGNIERLFYCKVR